MSTRAHPDYNAAPVPEEWQLRLYVTDWTPRCVQAFRNITRICSEYVDNKCNIEVVDLQEKPELARQDQIVVVPTLVKMTPVPQKILVGDMSDVDKVLRGLDVSGKDA